MPGPAGPRGPGHPTVQPSEPEQERQLLKSVLEELADDSSRRLIGFHNIRDFLLNTGLDVDEHGFIVNAETREYAVPYAHDHDTFREIESPVDNPLDTYYVPEENVTRCILSQGRIHLKDLHTINTVDGEPRPVRDGQMPISRQHMDTGLAFTTVTMWSDAADLVGDDGFPGPDVYVNHSGMTENAITLNCIRCEFTGGPDEWNGSESSPECPDCGGPWDTRGMEICTACQTTHWWEEIDHVGEGLHSEPRCPDCGADYNYLESQTHYSLFD